MPLAGAYADNEAKPHSTLAPLRFINPTRALFTAEVATPKSEHLKSSHDSSPEKPSPPTGHPAVTLKWTARNNRKGMSAQGY